MLGCTRLNRYRHAPRHCRCYAHYVENRSYLLGRALPAAERQEEVIAFLQKEPAIEKVIDFKSVAVGFGVYRIKCEIEFNGSALLREAYRNQTLRDQYEEEVHQDFRRIRAFLRRLRRPHSAAYRKKDR